LLVEFVCTCFLSGFCLLPFEEPENEAMISLVEQTSVVTQQEAFVPAEKPKNENPKNEDTKIEISKNETSEETHAGLPHQSQMVRPDTNVLPPQLMSSGVMRQAADSTSHSERLRR